MRAVFHLRAALGLIAGRRTYTSLLHMIQEGELLSRTKRKLSTSRAIKVLDMFASADPTPNHDYLRCMFNMYLRDLDASPASVIRAAKAERAWQRAIRDIFGQDDMTFCDFRTVEDVNNAISKAKEAGLGPDVSLEDADVEEVYNQDGNVIWKVGNHEGLCQLGGGTRWCSAKRDSTGRHYWAENKKYPKPNDVYVAEVDGKKYLVRVDRRKRIIVIRQDDDTPVSPRSKVGQRVADIFEDAKIGKLISRYYTATAGGAYIYGPEAAPYRRFAGYADTIQEFGFRSAAQWFRRLRQLRQRIAPTQILRFLKLFAGGDLIMGVQERAREAGISEEQLRDGFIRLLSEYSALVRIALERLSAS